MKKANKRISVFISIILTAAVTAAAAYIVVGRFKQKPFTADTATKSHLEDLSFNTDIVNVTQHNQTAKIDCINSGLDTYSLKSIIYDLKNDRVLSETDFSEGAWETGLTDDGFYVADTLKNKLNIYSNTGELIKTHNISNVDNQLLFCALSSDKSYFVYTDSSNFITVVDMKSQTEKSIPADYALRELCSFDTDTLYAVTVNSEIVSLNAKTEEIQLIMTDSRVNTFSADYCLGTTDTNFLVLSKDDCVYVPFKNVDEIPIGIGKNGFATAVCLEKTNILRIYDIKKSRVCEWETKNNIENVCFLDDGRILTVVGSTAEKKHSIAVCEPQKYEALKIYDSDITEKAESKYSIPKCDTESSSNAVIIKNVPVISQFPDYPTGCESVSAVMALQFSGENITVDEFISKHLPMSRDFYIDSDKKYGPSPYEYFVGNPKTSASYGCMSPVIEKAVTDYLGNSSRVETSKELSLEQLCKKYIDNNTPVLIWATINMLETNPVNSWYLSNGTRFTWPGNEHCLLLIGYSSEYYYFNDPYAGAMVKYEKQKVEDRFAELGKQSLVINA